MNNEIIKKVLESKSLKEVIMSSYGGKKMINGTIDYVDGENVLEISYEVTTYPEEEHMADEIIIDTDGLKEQWIELGRDENEFEGWYERNLKAIEEASYEDSQKSE